MLEAVALAMLAPLKTVQPITILVDRQTGFVEAIDPISPRRVSADEALTQSLLAQYVSAREGFDRATVSADYRRVALWSAGRARSSYLAEMPAANPSSPLQRYAGGTVVSVRVKSVSKLGNGIALVRFDTIRQDPNGYADIGQAWASVVRYRYVDAPMQFDQRLINPLGFQVTGYRRDAESPPAPAPARPAGWNGVPSPGSDAADAREAGGAMQEVPRGFSPRGIRSRDTRTPGGRRVPIDQVPLGSPLEPGAPAPGSVAVPEQL
jgi:type IV secretion system protein VirB8